MEFPLVPLISLASPNLPKNRKSSKRSSNKKMLRASRLKAIRTSSARLSKVPYSR